METIKQTFLEGPTYVYIALGIAMLVLAAIGYERRRKADAWRLLIPPALALIVLVVSTLVETDREKFIAAAKDISRSFEAGRMDRIPRRLDPNFTATIDNVALTKPMVEAFARTSKGKYRIGKVSLTDVEVTVTGKQARMKAVTRIQFAAEGMSGQTKLAWNVLWIEQPEGWLVLEVPEPERAKGL